jgi:hypothetical protein
VEPDLEVALFRISPDGVLILGRTSDELVLAAVRAALLLEAEAELARLARCDPCLRVVRPDPEDGDE